MLRLIIVVLLFFILLNTCQADDRYAEHSYGWKDEWTVEPFMLVVHNSALTKGAPFNDEPEKGVDELAVGVTFAWKRFEIDLTQGYKCIDCAFGEGRGEEASAIRVRWYPWRKL